MALEGSQAFALLKTDQGENRRIAGVVVEVLGEDIVLGVGAPLLAGISTAVTAGDLGFVRLPSSSISDRLPAGWKKDLVTRLPPARKLRAAWFARENSDLESSEAEVVAEKSRPPQSSRSQAPLDIQTNLSALKGLLGRVDEEEEEEEAEDSDDTEEKPFPPPGGRAKRSRKKQEKKDVRNEDPLLQLAMQQALTGNSGQGVDLQTILMLKMLQQQGGASTKKKKHRKSRRRSPSSSGGSSSDSEDAAGLGGRGMKAVRSLHKMHDRVLQYPDRIVKEFEKEVVEDLGICAGQSWTLLDWVKKQNFGKFRGMLRCCAMDVAVYELLRNKDYKAATAQVVQNLKAKHQSVLQQGEWGTAWLLTGLPDPINKREFAGSKSEMATISGYVSALAKLKKQVREAEAADKDEDKHDK